MKRYALWLRGFVKSRGYKLSGGLIENKGGMIKGSKVVLREKRVEDAALDYAWKMDEELARLDATIPLNIPFSIYLSYYVEELQFANIRGHRFAIDTLDGKHIGNCAYYNFDKDAAETELGIIIGDREYWDKGYGADAIIVFLNHLFEEKKLKRVCLHTLEWNIRAKECFQKCGFVSLGRVSRGGQDFTLMEIYREGFKSAG